MELQFSKAKKSLAEEPQTIGLLWAPDLWCREKPYFNDANWWGAIGFLTATMVHTRHSGFSAEVRCGVNWDQSLEAIKAHLAGLILVTDMRSDFFGDKYPVHNYLTSGTAHAVMGSFESGEFRDTYAHPNLRCLPACYKICAKRREMIGHRFSFGLVGGVFRCWKDELDSHCREIIEAERDQQSSSNLGEASDADLVSAAGVTDKNLRNAKSESVTEHLTPIKDAEEEAECIVCLERSPTFVSKKCGHFGICGTCRKWMCKEHFNKYKKQQSQTPPAYLRMDQVADAKLTCPICRTVTRAVYVDRNYKDVIYPV